MQTTMLRLGLLVPLLVLAGCLPDDSRRHATGDLDIVLDPGESVMATLRIEADADAAPRLIDLDVTVRAVLSGGTASLRVRDIQADEERAGELTTDSVDQTFRYECDESPCVRDFEVELLRTDEGSTPLAGRLIAFASGGVTCCGDSSGTYVARWIE